MKSKTLLQHPWSLTADQISREVRLILANINILTQKIMEHYSNQRKENADILAEDSALLWKYSVLFKHFLLMANGDDWNGPLYKMSKFFHECTSELINLEIQ